MNLTVPDGEKTRTERNAEADGCYCTHVLCRPTHIIQQWTYYVFMDV